MIRSKTIEEALENARQIARRRRTDRHGSVVDAFIAERRSEERNSGAVDRKRSISGILDF